MKMYCARAIRFIVVIFLVGCMSDAWSAEYVLTTDSVINLCNMHAMTVRNDSDSNMGGGSDLLRDESIILVGTTIPSKAFCMADLTLQEGRREINGYSFSMTSIIDILKSSFFNTLGGIHMSRMGAITFNHGSNLSSAWKNRQHYALDWDMSSFEGKGALKVKAGNKIPFPLITILSLLGLIALLIKMRRIF